MFKRISLNISLVIEEIESIINEYHKKGIELYSLQKFDEADLQAQKILEIEQLKVQIQEIETRLDNVLSTESDSQEIEENQEETKHYEKLPKGLKTPQKEFRLPILTALEKLGGRGNINEVIEIVASIMKTDLNKYDFQPLNSAPKFPRWRNTAQWERDTMVKEGLLLKDSPRTVWELSDEGKKYLANFKKQSSVEVSESVPLNLRYVFEVIEKMKAEEYSFEKACVRVGATNGHVNPTTIKENCTDLLGISKDQFISLLDNQEDLVELIISKFPDHRKLITEKIGKT